VNKPTHSQFLSYCPNWVLRELILKRISDQTGCVFYACFLEQVLAVRLHGVNGQMQHLGNLCGGMFPTNQPEHVALAGSEFLLHRVMIQYAIGLAFTKRNALAPQQSLFQEVQTGIRFRL
jgi:hypothetical protein